MNHLSLNNQSYIDFISRFECLTPYELNHFCGILYQHYQSSLGAADPASKSLLTQGDMKDILTQAMQAAQLDLAEQTLKNAEYNLQIIKSRMLKK